MKKIKTILPILLLLVTLFMSPCMAKAEEDTISGMVNFTADMSAVGSANVYLTLTNVTTNKDYTVALLLSKGNKHTSFLPLGSYTLKSSKVTSTNDYEAVFEGFIAAMDDFTIDYSRADFIWDIPVDITLDMESILAEGNEIPTYTSKEDDNHAFAESEADVFRIESDNAYFPGYSIKEIQTWYAEEVKKFLETGLTTKNLQYFQNSVEYWSDCLSRSSEATIELTYKVDVLKYDTEETQEFYKVQKKIYNFILDYAKDTGKYLNFEDWEEMEEVRVPTFTPEDVTGETGEPTPDDTGVTDTDTQETTPDSTETSEPFVQEPSKPSFGEKLVELLKDIWFTLFVLAAVGVIFFVVKKKHGTK